MCPTCSHTMQKLSENTFWCSRCGTIKTGIDYVKIEQPMLIQRCRDFYLTLGPSWGNLWIKLGINDAIYRPEER